MNQCSLNLSGHHTPYSYSEGDHLRDEGIERVMNNSVDWKEDALNELKKLWQERRHESNEFTFEMLKYPVIKKIGEPEGSQNIWGALAKKMRNLGWIQDTGKTCTAKTASRHSSLVRIYKWTS